MIKKIFPLGLITLIAVVLALPTPSSSQTSTLTVSVADVTQAGFTNVVRQETVSGKYKSPVNYFRVNESTIAANPAWGDASNIVAVNITTITDSTWEYNNSQIQTIDMAGRTQAKISRPGFYITVTGPDAAKVTELARILAEK
jgi:hypothetical protein